MSSRVTRLSSTSRMRFVIGLLRTPGQRASASDARHVEDRQRSLRPGPGEDAIAGRRRTARGAGSCATTSSTASTHSRRAAPAVGEQHHLLMRARAAPRSRRRARPRTTTGTSSPRSPPPAPRRGGGARRRHGGRRGRARRGAAGRGGARRRRGPSTSSSPGRSVSGDVGSAASRWACAIMRSRGAFEKFVPSSRDAVLTASDTWSCPHCERNHLPGPAAVECRGRAPSLCAK